MEENLLPYIKERSLDGNGRNRKESLSLNVATYRSANGETAV